MLRNNWSGEISKPESTQKQDTSPALFSKRTYQKEITIKLMREIKFKEYPIHWISATKTRAMIFSALLVIVAMLLAVLFN